MSTTTPAKLETDDKKSVTACTADRPAPAGYRATTCPTCGVATYTSIDLPEPRACWGCRWGYPSDGEQEARMRGHP